MGLRHMLLVPAFPVSFPPGPLIYILILDLFSSPGT